MIQLTPGERKVVRAILRRHIPRVRVGVFGSRAKGKARKFSDLDLVLLTAKPVSFARLGALENDFSESELPFRVDVVDWAATESEFRARIKREMKIL